MPLSARYSLILMPSLRASCSKISFPFKVSSWLDDVCGHTMPYPDATSTYTVPHTNRLFVKIPTICATKPGVGLSSWSIAIIRPSGLRSRVLACGATVVWLLDRTCRLRKQVCYILRTVCLPFLASPFLEVFGKVGAACHSAIAGGRLPLLGACQTCWMLTLAHLFLLPS